MLSFAMNPRILQIITILTKGGEKMAKTIKSIVFTQNDEALVEKITIYQKKNSLSFIAAVRELCETALKMETIVKKLG